MRKKFDTLTSELIFRNPYWDYRLDKYVLPNGSEGDYHFVDSRGACMVIPMLENNTFVMVRQYRYLNKKYSIEFPGGGLSKDKGIKQNAIDELKEEAGYAADVIEKIGEFNPYNGVTNEICNVFVAKGMIKTDNSPEETEEFEILELTEQEILDKIGNNEIWDGMTLASWSIYSNLKQ